MRTYLLLCLFAFVKSAALFPNDSIRLQKTEYGKMGTNIHISSPVKIWRSPHDTTRVDSVMYDWKHCTAWVKRRQEGMEYTVCCKPDSAAVPGVFSFLIPNDTLSKWKTGSYSHADKWIGNFWKTGNVQEDYGLLLQCYTPNFRYNDSSLNDFYLGHSILKINEVDFRQHKICIKKEMDNPLVEIAVFDVEGNRHRDCYREGRLYKNTYRIGDTISLEGSFVRVDSVGSKWKWLYFTSIEQPTVHRIPDDLLQRFKPYFAEGTSYSLLDFWGTWCKPCIAGFPKMKILYQRIRSRCNLLGICYDGAGNQEKMQQILAEKEVDWHSLLDEQSDTSSIVSRLGISHFPTYLLINAQGEILWMDYGIQGFTTLEQMIRFF